MKDKEKIEQLLSGVDDECENANYHDRIGMAQKLFDRIKRLVPEKRLIHLAEEIADGVLEGI